MHRYFFTYILFHYLRIAFLAIFVPTSGKTCFHATSAAENAWIVQKERRLPNFRANEWENLFSRNECSRKCGIYVVNAELAQLVEQLIRNE